MIETDHRYLRYALMVAERARDHGDRPFGAVLVSSRGRILVEAENAKHASRDCTSHAETRLLAQASRRFPRHLLSHCTLYVNAEPCPMCAGAIFWSGVGRVVFGIGAARLRQLVGQRAEQLLAPCAAVLANGTHSVEVVGPLFEDEAAQAFSDGLVLPESVAV